MIKQPPQRPKLSVFDLAYVNQGETPADALHHALDLARHVEKLGFHRFWVAEHHNTVAIASSATSVLMGYIAGGTETIRVGAGGIMLPNHSPLVIAEQFGTLESLYPGRIDLGLGRAPGTDAQTLRSLRRSANNADNFPQDVAELQAYFEPLAEGQKVQAVPGAGLRIPLWILGSSLFGAQLAAAFGLPYAFASHFAPDALIQALDIYRETFKPSRQLEKPYAVAAVNVVIANSEQQAQRLFTSTQQSHLNLLKNQFSELQPPVDDIDSICPAGFKEHLDHQLQYAFIGTQQTVFEQLDEFAVNTGVDEILVASSVFDQQARQDSYFLLGEYQSAQI